MNAANVLLSVLVFWIVAVALQIHNGAYQADIGADPDEPAHAVTSLMVRDYLVCGLLHGEHPMHFAQRYYDHFPKVALGHYPPGFYLLAGLWLLPRATPDALMVFMALLAAVFATTSVAAAYRCGLSKASALVVGLWVLILPITQNLTALVMSDLLLGSLCLLATMAFASFLDRPTAGSSLGFGILAAAAILTKASAVALALVPLSILIMRRWSLMKNWRLWLAPLPVLFTALPWTLMTMKITEEGMQSKSVAEYLPEALVFYAKAAGYSFGWLILLAALVSMVRSVPFVWKRDGKPNALMITMATFSVILLALYHISPTGLSSRYLLPIVPPMLIAAAFSFRELRKVWTNKPAAEFGIGIGAALSFVFIFPEHHKVASGFGEVAADLTAKAKGGMVLVSSDPRGEGSLIAEMAFLIPDRCQSPWTIVRASKFMATSDWSGRGYKTAFASREEFVAALQRDGVQWIVQDNGIPRPYRFEHHQQVDDWCATMKAVTRERSERQLVDGAADVVLFETSVTPAPKS